MIPVVTPIAWADWEGEATHRIRRRGWRYGHLTIRRTEAGARHLEALLLNPPAGAAEVLSARIPDGATEFPSLTAALPAVHWSEQLIGDLWGLRAAGHPRWKTLFPVGTWAEDEFPCALPGEGPFSPRESRWMVVRGEGVHEIPVGPIHAGVIEPGHFRFSCVGEVIANLEIGLGYVHRGVETQLEALPLGHVRHAVEAAASDSSVAHAMAHAEALESLWGFAAPRRAAALRTIALEIERAANHLGDLGSLASDVGFALGAATFGRLRGAALGLGQRLTGSRFLRGYICPGGVARDLVADGVPAFLDDLARLRPDVEEALDLVFGNPGVQERMEGCGILIGSLADDFGMVGPAARASGRTYDARAHYAHGLYPHLTIEPATEAVGDVRARAKVRRAEARSSLETISELASGLPSGPHFAAPPAALPADRVAVGVVEAWRGELIHWITTGPRGEIRRYVIRDPSFQNWSGLAAAVRGNLVMDFPLINKSFNLSYSGNDL